MKELCQWNQSVHNIYYDNIIFTMTTKGDKFCLIPYIQICIHTYNFWITKEKWWLNSTFFSIFLRSCYLHLVNIRKSCSNSVHFMLVMSLQLPKQMNWSCSTFYLNLSEINIRYTYFKKISFAVWKSFFWKMVVCNQTSTCLIRTPMSL